MGFLRGVRRLFIKLFFLLIILSGFSYSLAQDIDGEIIVISVEPSQGVAFRDAPSGDLIVDEDGYALATFNGDEGEIVEGPESEFGILWYLVHMNNGSEGWLTSTSFVLKEEIDLNPDRQPETVARINRETVNLRSGPGIDYPTVARGRIGEEYPILGYAQDSDEEVWYLLKDINHIRFWVSATLVTVNLETDAIALIENVLPPTDLGVGMTIELISGVALYAEPFGGHAVAKDGFLAGGPPGMKGTILDGPYFFNGQEWYQVRLQNNDAGWLIFELFEPSQ